MLPNNLSFSPFAILTAEEMNDLVENIEAVSDGTGVEDEAITTRTLADGAVTPEKRSGGFYIGTISGATLGTTGNKAITGVGFTPKLVKFTLRFSNSTTVNASSIGSMTAASQYALASASSGSSSSRLASTSDCMLAITAGSTTSVQSASYVSMDADGFTINVSIAAGIDASYEAYA